MAGPSNPLIYLRPDPDADPEMIRDVFNQHAVRPQSFGAVGDGEADDTEAIVKAQAKSQGKQLYFPRGAYKFTETISLLDDVDWYFEPGAKLLPVGDFEVGLSGSGVEDVSFRGLWSDGGDGECSVGLYLTGCSGIRIRRCRFDNFTRPRNTLFTSAILMHQVDDVEITRGRFYNNGYNSGPATASNGTIMFRASTVDSTRVRITDCVIENAGLFAIGGFDVSRSKFLNNDIDQGNVGNTDYDNGYGILLYDTGHATVPTRNHVIGTLVQGNDVRNCYGIGIYVVVGKRNKIIDNDVTEVALGQDSPTLRAGGIVVNESQDSIVRSNTIDGVASSGHFEYTAGIASLIGVNDKITDNTIRNVRGAKGEGFFCGGAGEIQVTSSGVQVVNNIISGCGGNGLRFDGSANKFDARVAGNLIESVGLVGMALERCQRFAVEKNTVKDWGTGQQAYLILNTSPGSPFNVLDGNFAVAGTGSATGHAFSIRSGNNLLRGNWVIGSGGAVAVGFFDSSGNNTYDGNMFAGVITTRWSVSGQSSFLGGNFSTGTAAPATTPKMVGEWYHDTVAGKFYVSKSTASAADWVALN
jgi:hypothetical protein